MKHLLWHLALLAGLACGTDSARADLREIPVDPSPAPIPGTASAYFSRCDGSPLLRVYLDDGSRFEGRLAGVAGDSVFLSLDTLAGARELGLPLSGVLRVDEQRSGFETGFRIGGTTGAVLGGGFGFLMGLALAGIGGAEDNEAFGAGIGVGLAGAAVGALSLGLTGGLIGSATDDWYRAFSLGDRTGAPPGPPPEPRSTRGDLMLGRGLTAGGEPEVSAWGGRFGLTQPVGAVALGPELGYWNLGATRTVDTGSTVTTTSGENLLLMGLTGTWLRRSPGLAPYLTLGGGLYFWNDPFFGISGGGGLRWRSANRLDIFLEGRYHLPVAGGSPNRPDGFLTLGAGFAFDL